MRILLSCMECAMERGPQNAVYARVPVNDDKYFEYVCPNGHHNRFLVQEPRYEILFELGVNAIMDGYYREAVSSIAASLERSQEHMLRLFLKETGRTDAKIGKLFKRELKYTERQAGAFAAIWVSRFGELPLTPDENTDVRLRNAAVHRGAIPSLEEVLQYSDRMLSDIYSNRQKTRGTKDRAFDFELDSLRNRSEYLKKSEVPLGSMSVPTIFRLQDRSSLKPTRLTREHINFLQQHRALYAQVPGELPRSE